MIRRSFFVLPAVCLIAGIFIITGCKKSEDNVVTDIDGNVYNIITIGDQQWMDRNLAVTRYRNGDPLRNSLGSIDDGGAWINYGNLESNGQIYGRLYNAYAIHDPRGLAPEGWHVPTLEEWNELIDYLGGSDVAGGKLKEAGLEHWLDPNTDATDMYGFSALPGGYAGGTGMYLGNYASFWTSTKVYDDKLYTWNLWLYSNNSTVEDDWDYGGSGYSIRCIRD